MAEDVFGNPVGDMLVMSANEAKITAPQGAVGFVLNATISYQMGINPVATFGKDTLFTLGTPQGQFSFGTVAGNGIFKAALDSSKCYGTDLEMTFKTGNCKGAPVSGEFFRELTENKEQKYTMHGAFTNGLQIQGQAQDAFFTQNVSGIFHYLS